MIVLIVVVLAFAVVGCGETRDDESIVPEESSPWVTDGKSLAFLFYDGIDPYKLFISFETVTDDGTVAKFAQAINGEDITTIIAYDDKTIKDLYEIFDHKTPTLIYQVDVAGKKYSAENKSGTANLFAGMDKSGYKNPVETGFKTLKSTEYYYESYGTGSSSTLFYFDKSTKKIYAIESLQDGKSVQVMENIKVTEDIPTDVLLGLPEDFEASEIKINTDIEWPAGW